MKKHINVSQHFSGRLIIDTDEESVYHLKCKINLAKHISPVHKRFYQSTELFLAMKN